MTSSPYWWRHLAVALRQESETRRDLDAVVVGVVVRRRTAGCRTGRLASPRHARLFAAVDADDTVVVRADGDRARVEDRTWTRTWQNLKKNVPRPF